MGVPRQPTAAILDFAKQLVCIFEKKIRLPKGTFMPKLFFIASSLEMQRHLVNMSTIYIFRLSFLKKADYNISRLGQLTCIGNR